MHAWPKLYEQRWEWASHAEDRFTAELPKSLQRQVKLRKGEYSVVLLGPTQVGKTSLVLDVLGCRSDRRTEVDTVLRAGRVLGMSSTSSETTYRWADDDELWTLTSGEETTTGTSSDMMNRLASQRSDDGCLQHPGDMVELSIPRQYRIDAVRTALPVLVDLPGLFGDGEHEHVQAWDVARSRVATANVVILVVNATQMTPLMRLGREGIAEVARWAFHPEKFRVVLTHAFSQASSRELLVPEMTVHQWRQTLLQELKSTSSMVRRACAGAELEKAVINALFPVEMGESMAGLRHDHPDAGAIATKLNALLMKEFVESLDAAAAQEAIYLSMPRAASIVRDRACDVLRMRTRRLEAAKANKERAASIVQKGCKIRDRDFKTLGRAMEMNSWWTSLGDIPVEMSWDNTTAAPANKGSKAEMRDHYANTLRTADEATKLAFDAWFGSDAARCLAKAVLISPPLPLKASTTVAQQIDCNNFCARGGKVLRCHTFSVFHPSDCLTRQVTGFENAKELAHKDLTSEIKKWLKGVADSKRFLDLELAKKKVASSDRALKYPKLQLKVESAAVAMRQAQCDKAEKDYEDAKRETSRLGGYLDEALRAQISRLEAFSSTIDADDQLATAFVYLLMLKGREKMKGIVE